MLINKHFFSLFILNIKGINKIIQFSRNKESKVFYIFFFLLYNFSINYINYIIKIDNIEFRWIFFSGFDKILVMFWICFGYNIKGCSKSLKF